MTALKNPEQAVPGPSPETAALPKLPPALRKLLSSTPGSEWPKIRAYLVESQEEGELVDLLPEMNRVMKYCPVKLMGRVGRREITADQLDKSYTQLHDSLNGVREALHELLHLAGFTDVRSREDAEPAPKGGAPEPSAPGSSPTQKHKPALTTTKAT